MIGVGVSGPTGLDAGDVTVSRLPARRPGAEDEERDAWAVLTSVIGVGPVALAALLDRYRDARAALEDASRPGAVERLSADAPWSMARAGRVEPDRRWPIDETVAREIVTAAGNADLILGRIRAAGLTVVTVDDTAYPRRLGSIELPPHVLFVLGPVAALDPAHAVAVVGTRRPTIDGRATASRLAAALVRAGATVVSGLAVGIDGAAHHATVLEGGTTVAVIGGGHDVLYPRAHRSLADRIVRSGGAIISEHAPNMRPSAGTFPRRNRVISGLSDATVVVEAPARSGALLTASWALEQGRECFLVPGSLDARASAGSLSFLRENALTARIVASIPTLLDDLGLIDHSKASPKAPVSAEAALVEIGGTAARIGREIVAGNSTVDDLVAVTGLPVATVLAALTILEARGLVIGIYGRYRAAGALASTTPRVRRVRDRAAASSG
jgi:DNA processing protein